MWSVLIAILSMLINLSLFHLFQSSLVLGKYISGPSVIIPLQFQILFTGYICVFLHVLWSSSLKSIFYFVIQTLPKLLLPPIKLFKATLEKRWYFYGQYPKDSTLWVWFATGRPMIPSLDSKLLILVLEAIKQSWYHLSSHSASDNNRFGLRVALYPKTH